MHPAHKAQVCEGRPDGLREGLAQHGQGFEHSGLRRSEADGDEPESGELTPCDLTNTLGKRKDFRNMQATTAEGWRFVLVWDNKFLLGKDNLIIYVNFTVDKAISSFVSRDMLWTSSTFEWR